MIKTSKKAVNPREIGDNSVSKLEIMLDNLKKRKDLQEAKERQAKYSRMFQAEIERRDLGW